MGRQQFAVGDIIAGVVFGVQIQAHCDRRFGADDRAYSGSPSPSAW